MQKTPMDTMFYQTLTTPLGIMEVRADQAFLLQVNLVLSKQRIEANLGNAVTQATVQQLQEYFAGERQVFDLPLRFNGTSFQKKVWNALAKIPYGESRSYGEVARLIRNSKACRAVGMANNRNPYMIIIPCHRVIGANKKLVGYASGLHHQEWLLDFEARALARSIAGG